jgi:hypothetical protein
MSLRCSTGFDNHIQLLQSCRLLPRWWHVQVRLRFHDLSTATCSHRCGFADCTVALTIGTSPIRTHRQLREMSMDEMHYVDRVSAAQLDPHNALGEEKLAALCEKHGKRLVAIELTNQYCTCCGEETDYFMELVCSRVCRDCFQDEPALEMCSVEYAKVLHNMRATTVSTGSTALTLCASHSYALIHHA